MSLVLFERKGPIAIATLNNPKALNALSLDMIKLLHPQLVAWQQDASVKAIWLQGAGDKAFCAGGDVVGLYHSINQTAPQQRNTQAEAFFEHEYRLDYLIHRFDKPIVCWGNGIVMGGGIGLMAGCSHRLVTPDSRLAMPEITIGLYPDVGGSRFLSRMPGDVGLFLGLTGASINATDAHYVGLADHVVASSSRDTLLQALHNLPWTDDDRFNDGLVSRLMRSHSLPLDAWPDDVIRKHYDVINSLCDADDLPDVVERICRYPGDDAWLQRAATTLAAGSPLSAWLVWLAQMKAQQLSLAEVFQMEWVLSMQCVYHADLKEGVRALLVDKDKSPRFTHASVKDVTETELAVFFELPAGVTANPLADL